jgi:hypothetical protein
MGMRVKRYASALLFFILAVSTPVAAGDYNPDQILTFTRFLIGKQEYYRALVELKRLNSYHPGFLAPAAYHVTELYLLSKGKQFPDILNTAMPSGDPFLASAGLIFKCDAAIGASDNTGLESLLASWQYGADPFFDRCVRKRQLYASLISGTYDAAGGICGPPEVPDYGACRELIGWARSGIPGEKKPWLAAVLGLVPGAGYLYSGEIATGVFAFLLIAADAVLTYFAFSTRNDVIGYFSGAIGGLFYAGSIAGGYFAASRYNVKRFETAGSSLSARMKLESDREDIFNRYGIGSDGKP